MIPSYDHGVAVFQGREEFVNGRTREVPLPCPGHACLVQTLHDDLCGQLKQSDRAYVVLVSSYALGIERDSPEFRNPDLAVFVRDDLSAAHEEHGMLFATPLLVVECLYPFDRKGHLADLVRDYERMQAREVWFIDPLSRTVTSYFPNRSGYTLGDPLRPKELPQVVIPLQRLWSAFNCEW